MMKFLGSKTLETERLMLRATEKQDLKRVWEILCIPEVNRYYLICKFNLVWEKELPWQMKKLEYAKDNDVFQWSIILKNENKCIGQISVQEKGNDKSVRDIGWFIAPEYQGQKYAFEAASKVLYYMFNEVQINAIETCVATCNLASENLMKKLGFVKRTDTTHIVHYTFGGDAKCYSYGLTKDEYKEKVNNKKA